MLRTLLRETQSRGRSCESARTNGQTEQTEAGRYRRSHRLAAVIGSDGGEPQAVIAVYVAGAVVTVTDLAATVVSTQDKRQSTSE